MKKQQRELKRRINISISPKVHEVLKAEAKERGMTVSGLIEMLARANKLRQLFI